MARAGRYRIPSQSHQWGEPFVQPDLVQVPGGWKLSEIAQCPAGIFDAGEFHQADEKFMMLTILSSLNWTYNWYKPTGSLSPEEIGKKLANLILNGLKR